MGLDNIVKNNQYPILFLGSGISKRYLKNFPSWEDLLIDYWGKINESASFFSYQHEITQKNSQLSISEQNFIANIEMAEHIQAKFDDLFYKDELEVPNLTSEKAQKERLSPFKVSLANKFSNYELRDDINSEELSSFQTLLSKSRIIVTTNYDSFIEDQLKRIQHEGPKVLIGESGLFDPTNEWSEVYKLHGSYTNPNSLVITKSDYDRYDKKSVLVTAKILSSMIDSPIIFFGYSLTDRNVTSLLTDFSRELPHEDARKSADRIIVVDWEENNSDVQERIERDSTLDFTYTSIKTDNYKSIFDKLSKINEGATPNEVRKYTDLIKKLVVSAGHKGALETVLLSPTDLDELNDRIDNNLPVVVALGDVKNIFVSPNPRTYLSDYILEKNEIYPEVGLRFVARQGRLARYPFLRYWNEVDLTKVNLEQYEIDSINYKISALHQNDLQYQLSCINKSHQKDFKSLNSILSAGFHRSKLIDVISYNAHKFPFNEFDKYVKKVALPAFISTFHTDANLGTAYRRLFLIWDILKNKK